MLSKSTRKDIENLLLTLKKVKYLREKKKLHGSASTADTLQLLRKLLQYVQQLDAANRRL